MHDNCPLTKAMLEIVEAILLLRTCESNPLAEHLHRAENTIRTELFRAMEVAGVHSRFELLTSA